MNIHNFDLNLLAAFDAVYREKHVSRAAVRLGVSQPAMSNALRRLREALNDPLFIKVRTGVTPTPFAVNLAPTISKALRLLESGLQQAATFDPLTSERRFFLAMSDVGAISILPDVIDICKRSAPRVRMETNSLGKGTLSEDLENGTSDLAIGFLADSEKISYQQTLFTTEYVCLARQHHPAIRRRLTQGIFCNAEHVVAPAEFTGHAVIAEMLEAHGAEIGIKAPNFSALPYIVARTDCFAVVPRPLAFRAAAAEGVAIYPVPIELPPIDVRMFWSERVHHDPANLWLRKIIRHAFERATWD